MNFFKRNSCDREVTTSLPVLVTEACNCHCQFCICQRYPHVSKTQASPEAMVQAILATRKKEVQLLGGEPLLAYERTKAIVFGIYREVPRIYLTTTLPCPVDTELLDKLTCVNVSLQAVDDSENRKLLNVCDGVNRIQNLRNLLCLNPGKVRVNLLLRQGGIDTLRKLETALDFLYNQGVKDVKLVELQHYDDLYVSYSKLTGKVLGPAYAYGCERKLDPFVDMKMSIKLACVLVSDEANTGFPDLLKYWWKRATGNWNRDFTVVHPDASRRDTW